MKKLLIIVLGFLLSGNVGYTENTNQRLDKIEKRLEKIEESLSGLDFIKNLLNTNALDNNSKTTNNTKINKSKLSIELKQLNCFEDSIGFKKITIRYVITNNYKKKVKLVDATIIAKDLLDDEIFRGKISRDVYLDSEKSDTIGGTYDDLIYNHCGKIKAVEFPDIKYVLDVSKIAFEDNTVLEF